MKRTWHFKASAVRFLSMFLCVLMILSLTPIQAPRANSKLPQLYINDRVFADWEKTPPQIFDNVVYIPITMFMDIDSVYYFSNPKAGSFYLQNEITQEYLSFSLKTNDVYNGKGMIKINVRIFNNTMYLPAIQTANYLGLFVEEINSDKVIVRISDSSAAMSFSKLLALYDPIDTQPVTPPPVQTNPTPDPPTINPCNAYISFVNPRKENLSSLLVALQNENLNATFFFTWDYMISNPDAVLQIYTEGHSAALSISGNYTDFEALYSDAEKANQLLERITKKKSRQVFVDSNCNLNLLNQLESKGYIIRKFNITPTNTSSSKAIANSVISKMNSHKEAFIRLNTDIYSISSLYEIGKYISVNNSVHSYSLDETV